MPESGPLGVLPVTWHLACLRLGEELASHGPLNYYEFTAEEWLTWALQTVREMKIHA